VNGHRGTFVFGSYGRVLVASDAAGRPARESDIVAYGSRVDADNYVELELRREDHWEATGIDTRIVSTLAIGNAIFHYDGVFDAQVAVRRTSGTAACRLGPARGCTAATTSTSSTSGRSTT
jgi:hypothetical protein